MHSATDSPLLDVHDLAVTFNLPTGPVRAVRGVDFALQRGEILGVVGESGCGKSAAFRALLGLAPASASVTGTVALNALSEGHGIKAIGAALEVSSALRSVTAMIYQNPGAALNPVFTIGAQLGRIAGTTDRERLIELLRQVGMPEPEEALEAYPHQYSGGMKQRAMIAMALAQEPLLLVADEPTTALDVTTQAQILDLLAALRDQQQLSVVFVSHDLAVVQKIADRIVVLYAGQVVETGLTAEVLQSPLHPYTQALVQSSPTSGLVGTDLPTIEGQVPDGRTVIGGCAFAPRCAFVHDECTKQQPVLRLTPNGQAAACVLVDGP